MHPTLSRWFSPDRDILGTDFVPDKQTASSICSVMIQQKEEMKRIEEVIRGLEAQKESIQCSYNVNRALVASERKLPPEMLSEVFRRYLEPDITSYHETQLLLMQVCRRWRRIAAGTPSLWTNIFLKDSKFDPCKIIRTGLANSGALPMTASVVPSAWLKQWNEQEAIQLLMENFHRFRHFLAEGDGNLYREIFGHDTLIHAPLLESFILYGHVVVPPPLPSGERIRAPQLTSISLPHTSPMDLISFNPMSLSEVTLDIRGLQEILPSLHFLASCPGICSLDLTIREAILPPRNEGRSRILLPCLEKLTIAFSDGYDPCAFLRTIEVPALETLWINREDHGDAQDLTLLPATLDSLFEHNPPLQYLGLGQMDLDDGPMFATMLGRLQSLCSLTLLRCTIKDSILKSLTLDAGSLASEWKCPLLSELFVSYSGYSHDLFLRLVRSRTCTNPDLAAFGGQYLRHVDASFIEYTRTYTDSRRKFIADLDDIRQSCGGHLRVVF